MKKKILSKTKLNQFSKIGLDQKAMNTIRGGTASGAGYLVEFEVERTAY